MKGLVVFDLDDTLMAEADFVNSALRKIAASLAEKYGMRAAELYSMMQSGANPFDSLLEGLSEAGINDLPAIPALVEAYRKHCPASLPFLTGAEELLQRLKDNGFRLALVTDGRVGTQSAKIRALGLERFMESPDMIISEATGFDKTSAHNFEVLVNRYPELDFRCYVGDNPAKDFIIPRRMGWTTIALRDTTGRNIHPQDFNGAGSAMPHFIVDCLSEVYDLICQEC